eukprot:TRINITY_DN65940_c12_g1_i2.p1 TRINITY_DN65940_c12_g1~~TRINITY_DN65940_c12_g1_i2.p1  ORF type:complete len:848 (+),score=138.66 TRINITY_DN65940_c12_g1_i2:78-2546(+)
MTTKKYSYNTPFPAEEGDCVEFKNINLTTAQGERLFQSQVCKELCAFLNTNSGGQLFFGIHDSGTVLGFPLSVDERDKMRITMANIITASFCAFSVKNVAIQTEFLPVIDGPEERHIFKIAVTNNTKDSPKLHYFNKSVVFGDPEPRWVAYQRLGSTCQRLAWDIVIEAIQKENTARKRLGGANVIQLPEPPFEFWDHPVRPYSTLAIKALPPATDIQKLLQTRFPQAKAIKITQHATLWKVSFASPEEAAIVKSGLDKKDVAGCVCVVDYWQPPPAAAGGNPNAKPQPAQHGAAATPPQPKPLQGGPAVAQHGGLAASPKPQAVPQHAASPQPKLPHVGPVPQLGGLAASPKPQPVPQHGASPQPKPPHVGPVPQHGPGVGSPHVGPVPQHNKAVPDKAHQCVCCTQNGASGQHAVSVSWPGNNGGKWLDPTFLATTLQSMVGLHQGEVLGLFHNYLALVVTVQQAEAMKPLLSGKTVNSTWALKDIRIASIAQLAGELLQQYATQGDGWVNAADINPRDMAQLELLLGTPLQTAATMRVFSEWKPLDPTPSGSANLAVKLPIQPHVRKDFCGVSINWPGKDHKMGSASWAVNALNALLVNSCGQLTSTHVKDIYNHSAVVLSPSHQMMSWLISRVAGHTHKETGWRVQRAFAWDLTQQPGKPQQQPPAAKPQPPPAKVKPQPQPQPPVAKPKPQPQPQPQLPAAKPQPNNPPPAVNPHFQPPVAAQGGAGGVTLTVNWPGGMDGADLGLFLKEVNSIMDTVTMGQWIPLNPAQVIAMPKHVTTVAVGSLEIAKAMKSGLLGSKTSSGWEFRRVDIQPEKK